MPADILVFDLDNTLYPASSRLFDQVDARMSRFVQDLLEVDFMTARALQKDYFHRYGTTLVGLMKHHQVKPGDFLDYVHELDLSGLTRDPRLHRALEQHQGQKVVFTNGSLDHARNILGHLDLLDHFDGIFDIVAAGFRPKPQRETYQAMLDAFGIDPRRAMMFDDIPRNLEPAAELGMQTVWINEDTEYAHLGSASGTPIHHYVHHATVDLPGWLVERICQ